jgi:hypothetical protein
MSVKIMSVPMQQPQRRTGISMGSVAMVRAGGDVNGGRAGKGKAFLLFSSFFISFYFFVLSFVWIAFFVSFFCFLPFLLVFVLFSVCLRLNLIDSFDLLRVVSDLNVIYNAVWPVKCGHKHDAKVPIPMRAILILCDG